jgi:hypothetical protein
MRRLSDPSTARCAVAEHGSARRRALIPWSWQSKAMLGCYRTRVDSPEVVEPSHARLLFTSKKNAGQARRPKKTCSATYCALIAIA